MSVKSQENNMRRLAELLSHNLSYIYGEREAGPNGDKKTFLNLGKVFLRALAKDLGLRDVKVTANPAGIGVSGDCSLYGMWEESGIYICLEQLFGGSDNVVLYRSIRDLHDHKGGYNRFLSVRELRHLSYEDLLDRFLTVRRDGGVYGRAA